MVQREFYRPRFKHFLAGLAAIGIFVAIHRAADEIIESDERIMEAASKRTETFAPTQGELRHSRRDS